MAPPSWFWPLIAAASAAFLGVGALLLLLGVRPVASLLLVLVYAPVLGWTWARCWR